MNAIMMYGLAITLLVISSIKDKKKTKGALKKGVNSFLNIFPQMLGILTSVGIIFSFFDADTISKIVGSESGWVGVILSAVVGSITLIPGFIAFPMADMVLKNGGGYMQIGAFVSSLMMVGVMTASLEMKYFGKKLTLVRNIIAFFFSLFVAYIIGRVVV
ncbi:MAG: hypothetical protein JXQ26_00755 [Tissierellales bacterium]|nr:hypothetical protein [Tissierellales bacterium]MBN2826486.1 hypothetical protein [Tissierellales bacterium]